MTDLGEFNAFFQTWNRAIGPGNGSSSSGKTEAWLRDFGAQTKWLTGESWTWWMNQFSPPSEVDAIEARNFLALLIGMLGDFSPQGEAVQYAREMIQYLENGNN